MGIDPKDVDALQKALNDAAGKASLLWTAFVTFELYLAIAFAAVTHRDLFLETPIKLPVLNVDLPLVGFFVVAPTVLVIFHFYVFLQLLALAKKAGDYDLLLRELVSVEADRQYIRQRLDPFLVLQFLAGPRDQRTGSTGLWLRLIAWITLVGAPVVILLQAQVTFLPYHNSWVLWWLRSAVIIVLIIVWYYWIQIRSSDRPIVLGVTSRLWQLVGWMATIFVAAFSVCVATFPGEWIDRLLPRVSFIPTSDLLDWSKPKDWASPHDLLFAGEINQVSSKPVSLFSDRLVLTDQNIVDIEKLDKVRVSLSLRGRDFNRAVLSRADLRKADFTGANLEAARIDGAKLEGAKFECADNLSKSDQESEQPHFLPRSQSWPADGCAWLRMADLSGAQMQGASFNRARLQGANFNGSNLQGANFSDARLQGSLLGHANLTGARFGAAKLQGAFMERSQIWAADFTGANLDIASLFESELQGANLSSASLRGARLDGAFIWHVTGTPGDSESMTWGRPTRFPEKDQRSRQPLKADQLDGWRKATLKLLSYHQLPELFRDVADLSAIDPRTTDTDLTPKSIWDKSKSLSLKEEMGSDPPVEIVVAAACGSEAAFQVLSSVSALYAYTGSQLRKMLADMKASGQCPGYLTLTAADFDRLAEGAKQADERTPEPPSESNKTQPDKPRKRKK
jgi:uncharacterized protein YjbI with pentapeptide repeats